MSVVTVLFGILMSRPPNASLRKKRLFKTWTSFLNSGKSDRNRRSLRARLETDSRVWQSRRSQLYFPDDTPHSQQTNRQIPRDLILNRPARGTVLVHAQVCIAQNQVSLLRRLCAFAVWPPRRLSPCQVARGSWVPARQGLGPQPRRCRQDPKRWGHCESRIAAGLMPLSPEDR